MFLNAFYLYIWCYTIGYNGFQWTTNVVKLKKFDIDTENDL